MVADSQIDAWQRLQGKVSPLILTAPKTGGDPLGNWVKVHERLVRYLERNIVGKPWIDPLALVTAVMIAHRLDITTVISTLRVLNGRWDDLFLALGLQGMQDWKVKQHMQMYLAREVLPNDSEGTRITFWRTYSTAVNHVRRWLKSLTETDQVLYQPFLLSELQVSEIEDLVSTKDILERQRQKRKDETDALMPHFLTMRAQAHLRYNQLVRLRQAWQQALQQTISQAKCSLPLPFFYDEGQERLHFRLWDRRSFVIAHHYSKSSVRNALRGTGAFSAERNTHFLELVRTEGLSGEAPPAGFWFEDMLKMGVVGLAGQRIQNQELSDKRQAWLRTWGYGMEDTRQRSAPFGSPTPGILGWTLLDGVFMTRAQQKAKGVLIPVESLYTSALFGLLAVDLLTTTGMRINELMQIRLTEDCFTRVELPATVEGQPPKVRYSFHLIPKGERSDKPHDYFISKETTRLLVKVANILEAHYNIDLSRQETLPSVRFNPENSRSHRFGTAPYLFQYNHRHFSDREITACLRFLLHGMTFRTREGNLVLLKPHLLRHGFANYAVQNEKVPIDIVKAWLHQKNVDITAYYSQATATQIAEHSDMFLSGLSSHASLREYILRSPAELRAQREAAIKQIGTLNPVNGGDCTFHGFCTLGFSCNGCIHKVPDPSKRYQVQEKLEWAKVMLKFTHNEGLLPEAEQMKQLMRHCDIELLEMNQIEAYQEDEGRDITIRIEPAS